ncbi:hypothetical protein A6A04_07830 [Paramagnetospirillum marisnigri]|uniref:Phenylacetyl-CoA:acceptor oxidoreductase n=1 Tax=Paramagnetospirillum marisnigri TaxID=1285242 RepID=A0A178M860_9PROT|nr:hypothetical protein [Paramagnetospirillum marisnigri]OAN44723.1 hypothetical protein A6A04_07830 [Paramagnetospirillum marisnigri]
MKQINTAKRQRFWDLRAAGNFIGGGTGTGMLLGAVAASVLGLDITIPLVVGLGFVMAGLSLVWLEIGKPWRALNVFFHPQTSWMTREGILAGPLALATAGYVLFGPPVLLPVIAGLAAGFLYCQARILRAARGIPAWKHPRSLPLIVVTGLAEGSGLLLLLVSPPPILIIAALAAGLAREVALAAYLKGLAKDGAPQASQEVFTARPARLARQAGWAGLALLAVAFAFDLGAMAAAGGVLSAASGWGLKALLVTRAAFTRGPRITHTPVRGRGLSRVVEA